MSPDGEQETQARAVAPEPTETRLNRLIVAAGMDRLQPSELRAFESYISLILRWNARINLTAVRDEEGILARHIVESIACAGALPDGISTLLDFGSGAGFPGIPIAICRPEIAVALAEAQGKKAAFLQEAARILGLPVTVHSARAETLQSRFDCVTLRAVDKMPIAVETAGRLIRLGGWLALMTTTTELRNLQNAASASFSWSAPIPLPGSEKRILALGARQS